MAVKNATHLLDDFCAAGIAVEVTHRSKSKRRLFGLSGLAPLRDVARPPYRTEPGRGRGRPRLTPPAPLMPIDRRPFDYSDLARWMTQMDQRIRDVRRTSVPCQRGTARRPTSRAARGSRGKRKIH
jgi:hypothetical protein